MRGMTDSKCDMLDTLDGWAWLRDEHERNATCSMGGHVERTMGMSEMQHARRTRWLGMVVGRAYAKCYTAMGGHGCVKCMSEM